MHPLGPMSFVAASRLGLWLLVVVHMYVHRGCLRLVTCEGEVLLGRALLSGGGECIISCLQLSVSLLTRTNRKFVSQTCTPVLYWYQNTE